jgi:2-dehydropantoate 2-reductase
VLTLQNGLGNEEQLARLFSPKQILGGLCFVCLNRVGPSVIQHIDHGRIVLGEHLRPPEARTHDLAVRFRAGGVPCEVTDDLTRAHWEKLVWNIPFNGLGVAGAAGLAALERGFVEPQASRGATLTTEQLLGDPRWEGLVRELMLEVVRVAQALGLGVSEALAETQITRTRTMGAYKASTVLDFEQGRPLELQSLFFEPLRQAKKAGVPAPRLEALCAVLSALSAEPHSARSAEKA